MGQSAEVRVLRGDVIHGPFSREQVLGLLGNGKITQADMVSVQNGPWVRVSEYLGEAAPPTIQPITPSQYLGGPSAPPPAPPRPAPTGSPPLPPAPPPKPWPDADSSIPVTPLPPPPTFAFEDDDTSSAVPPWRNQEGSVVVWGWIYRGLLVVALVGVACPWFTASASVSAPTLGVGGSSRASLTGLSIVWGLLSLLAILTAVVFSFLLRIWQVHSGLAGLACGLTVLAAVQLSSATPFGVNAESSFGSPYGSATASVRSGIDWGLWLTLIASGAAVVAGFVGGSPGMQSRLGMASPRARMPMAPGRNLGILAIIMTVVIAVLAAVWSATGPSWSSNLWRHDKSEGIATTGKSAAEARKELLATAKKMEGGLAEAVESYVESVENGGFSWATADEQFLYKGTFTPETRAAYQRWRAAKIKETKK